MERAIALSFLIICVAINSLPFDGNMEFIKQKRNKNSAYLRAMVACSLGEDALYVDYTFIRRAM